MSDDLEDLREQTETGSRIDESLEERSFNLSSAIETALKELDDGERKNIVGIRDDSLAALLTALEEADKLDNIGRALEKELNRTPSADHDKSSVIRLAVRLGIQTAEPELIDELADAKAKRARKEI